MRLLQKVRAVERIFNDLDKEITSLKNHTQLGCIAGCGRCCEKPDIDASVLEFLPWAYHTFLAGKAEAAMEQLQAQPTGSICMLYHHLHIAGSAGRCSEYTNRGLICRLFGYSTKRDKYGKPQLLTCRRIKEETSEAFEKANHYLEKGGKAPVAVEYYDRLRAVDTKLATELLPINKALLGALKEVLSYYSYRRPPVRRSA